jgi:hypothetical protein
MCRVMEHVARVTESTILEIGATGQEEQVSDGTSSEGQVMRIGWGMEGEVGEDGMLGQLRLAVGC